MHADNAVNAANRETFSRSANCRDEEKMNEELPSTARTTYTHTTGDEEKSRKARVNSTRPTQRSISL
jgi:hypothetical protein